MRVGMIIGLVGSLVGSAAVAGASYYGWELYQAGSVDKRFAAFKKFEDALDIEFKYDRDRIQGEAFTPGFAVEKVTILSDGKSIEVDRLEFKRFDWRNPQQPRFSEIVLTGVKVKGEMFSALLGPELAKALADPKFETVLVDATLAHEAEDEEIVDPQTKRRSTHRKVTIKELRLAIRDLGTVTAEITLRDFDVVPKAVARTVVEVPPLVRLLGERVQFTGMRLTFEDHGYTATLMEHKASEIGKGILQARTVFVRDLQRDAQETRSAVGSNRFDKDYFEPMIAYVGGGYEKRTGFTVTSTPPAPIEVRRLFVMWDKNRGGFFDKFNPKLTLGPARAAAPKRDEPKKKKDEPRRERAQ